MARPVTLFTGQWADLPLATSRGRSPGGDLHEPGGFVSFGAWASIDQVKAWKGSPEFRERIAQVLQHADAFHPTELELVATAEDGAAASHAAATVA